jgi:hypothetical protein
MICSSVNRLGFMSIPFQAMDSTHFWRSSRGSAQPQCEACLGTLQSEANLSTFATGFSSDPYLARS